MKPASAANRVKEAAHDAGFWLVMDASPNKGDDANWRCVRNAAYGAFTSVGDDIDLVAERFA